MALSGSTTGTNTNAIAAATGAVQAGSQAQSGDVNTITQSVVNDLATIRDSSTAGLPSRVAKTGDTMTGGLTVQTGTNNSIATTGDIESTGGFMALNDIGETLHITAATNASPIVVTVSPAPNVALVDGALVTVASVGGNTAANGTWVVKQTGHAAGTFELVGSSGNGAYTSGGTVTRAAQVIFGAGRTSDRVLSRSWDDGVNSGATQGWTLVFPGDGVFVAFNASPTTNQQIRGWNIGEDEAPQGSLLNSVSVDVQPKSGHSGVPSTLPSTAVYKRRIGGGAASSVSLGGGTWPGGTPANAGAYQVYSTIKATLGTPEIVDHTRWRYLVLLATEIGTNALDGLQVFGASINVTARGLDQR